MTFEEWIGDMVEKAMREGLVTMNDIQYLCKSAEEEAYETGYQKGKKEGYSLAVRDMERESKDDF